MDNHIQKWSPRIGIIGAVIAVITGSWGLFKLWGSNSAVCEDLGSAWTITQIVDVSSKEDFVGDTMVFTVIPIVQSGSWEIKGEQQKYGSAIARLHRRLTGIVLCDGEEMTISYTWHKSEKDPETRDIDGTMNVRRTDSGWEGSFVSVFNGQSGRVIIDRK
jgi:hypothetical protein